MAYMGLLIVNEEEINIKLDLALPDAKQHG